MTEYAMAHPYVFAGLVSWIALCFVFSVEAIASGIRHCWQPRYSTEKATQVK